MKRKLLALFFIISFFVSFGQLNMNQLGQMTYNNSISDIWGYVDALGNEYALVGVSNGFSVVDVTDPASPVEVYFESGINSIWRDIKTWNDYAYVSTEGGTGILIVDLSPLPGTITSSTHFTGTTYPFNTVHNVYVDEVGKLYIFGSDNGEGGAIICDLTANPMSPVELGRFDDYYLHDGMARGDTLWGAAIYEGALMTIDVSDPANPAIMGTVNTPNNFTHNSWVSDDGTHVFTTDEESGAFVTAYDVTDLSNMIETDRVQSSPGEAVIPHNVHVNNNFLVSSYYTDGVVIHDATRPGNLIEVGNFDTAPNYSGSGYDGCWGAYPFLPSGNIVASDMQEGLYILETDYQQACYVEGNVTDSITGSPIENVSIRILSTEIVTQSGLDGNYAFGTAIPGTYNIEFSHADYPPVILENIELVNGQLTVLDIVMSSWFVDIPVQLMEDQSKTYPNPFDTELKIEYKLKKPLAADASIRVFDLAGKLIETIGIQSTDGLVVIGMDYPRGTYFIRINNGVETLKIQQVSKY